MVWLSNHFWLLFGGVGGTAVVALAIFWLERKRRGSSSTLTVHDSQLTGSPVASGSQINQHNYFNAAPAPVAPDPATPGPIAPSREDRPRLNIHMTGAREARLIDMGYGVMSEDVHGGEQALVIRFTNEPGAGVVGGPVRASIAYESGDPVDLRIIGMWVDSDGDTVRFRVDDSLHLLVGLLYERRFVALGKMLFEGAIRTELHDVHFVQAVRVRLTDANDGFVLYEGRFRVTVDPLTIVPDVIGQADVRLFRST